MFNEIMSNGGIAFGETIFSMFLLLGFFLGGFRSLPSGPV